MKKQLNPHVTPHLTPLAEDPSQPSYIRELLEAGRNARVSGYDFEQGLGAHLARIGSGAPLPEWAQDLKPAAAPAAGAAAGKGLIGWVLAPALAIVVGASIAFVLRPGGAPTPTTTPLAQAPVPSVAPSTLPLDSASTPHAVPSSTAPAVARNVTKAPGIDVAPSARLANDSAAKASNARSTLPIKPRSPSAPAAQDRAPVAAPVATIPTPSSAPAPKAASAADTRVAKAGDAQQTAPAVAAQAPAEPVAKPQEKSQQVATEKAPLDDARLEREMAMLSMTERVLKTDPERALRLARQGESEFAGSMFTQERQQLLLLALVKLGRMDEAKRLAKPYLARFSKGPFSDRVRRALATGQLDP